MVDNVSKIEVDGKKAIYLYESLSGVLFHVLPINLPTLRAIQLKAQDTYPYPDKAPYQMPDPVEVSFSEGQASKAEDNPDYLTACRAVDVERKRWCDRAVFDYAVTCPKYPTKDALVSAYKPQLERLRAIAVLPDDDYEAVLFHIVLTWNQVAVNKSNQYTIVGNEYGRIIDLAVQTVALEPAEVQAGIRFFRPVIRR